MLTPGFHPASTFAKGGDRIFFERCLQPSPMTILVQVTCFEYRYMSPIPHDEAHKDYKASKKLRVCASASSKVV